jgi:hypothetical protein
MNLLYSPFRFSPEDPNTEELLCEGYSNTLFYEENKPSIPSPINHSYFPAENLYAGYGGTLNG